MGPRTCLACCVSPPSIAESLQALITNNSVTKELEDEVEKGGARNLCTSISQGGFGISCPKLSLKRDEQPHLSQEDDSCRLIQGSAVHVDGGAQRHHKAYNALLTPHLLCTVHRNLSQTAAKSIDSHPDVTAWVKPTRTLGSVETRGVHCQPCDAIYCTSAALKKRLQVGQPNKLVLEHKLE